MGLSLECALTRLNRREVASVVSVSHDEGRRLIILRPNRSADWHQNRMLWMLLFSHSSLIATGFALAGAWMILPFAGLELLLLGAALWYVNWKCNHQQVITLDGASLAIDKGVLRPRRRWRFVTVETSVSVLEDLSPTSRRESRSAARESRWASANSSATRSWPNSSRACAPAACGSAIRVPQALATSEPAPSATMRAPTPRTHP
jgi:uncharacterized membrane protein